MNAENAPLVTTKRRVSTGYKPHAGQSKFHRSTAKFRAIITGIAYGKSCAGANEMLKNALKYPDALHLILAPTSKIMKNGTLPQFFKFCPPELIAAHIKYEQRIHLTNGAVIIYLTADNERHIDRLRGIEIGDFWADEAALLQAYVWYILIGRLRDGHGPLKGWITTTPKGMYTWTYFTFIKKVDTETREPHPRPDDFEWFGGTTMDNPYLPEEYKQSLLDNYHGAFLRQEVYGEFTSFAGMVFDNFRMDLHVLKARDEPDHKAFKEYIFGLDLGFTNETACLWIGLDNDRRPYLLEEYYRTKSQLEDVADWLKNVMSRYHAGSARGYADPSQPGSIAKLITFGLNISGANNDVAPGIQTVYNCLALRDDKQPGMFVSERCKNYLEELGQYRYEENQEGKLQKEQPVKVKDHLQDACRYALHTHLGMAKMRYGFLKDPGNLMGLQ